mgnify:CR=1 FL=1
MATCLKLMSHLNSALGDHRRYECVRTAHGHGPVCVASLVVLWWVGQRSAITFENLHILYFFVQWRHHISSTHTLKAPCATDVPSNVWALPMARYW